MARDTANRKDNRREGKFMDLRRQTGYGGHFNLIWSGKKGKPALRGSWRKRKDLCENVLAMNRPDETGKRRFPEKHCKNAIAIPEVMRFTGSKLTKDKITFPVSVMLFGIKSGNGLPFNDVIIQTGG